MANQLADVLGGEIGKLETNHPDDGYTVQMLLDALIAAGLSSQPSKKEIQDGLDWYVKTGDYEIRNGASSEKRYVRVPNRDLEGLRAENNKLLTQLVNSVSKEDHEKAVEVAREEARKKFAYKEAKKDGDTGGEKSKVEPVGLIARCKQWFEKRTSIEVALAVVAVILVVVIWMSQSGILGSSANSAKEHSAFKEINK